MRTNPACRPRAAIALLLAAAGCATTNRVELPIARRLQLTSVETVAGFARPEISPTVDASSAGGGFGFLGLLVDAGVNNHGAKGAEGLIAPVRDGLLDHDADAVLGAALQRSLERVAWLKAGKIEVRPLPPSPKRSAEVAGKAEADAVLLLEADHRLGPDFGDLVVTVRANLLPAHGKLAPARIPPSGPAPLYQNTLWAQVRLPDLPKKPDPARAAERWAKDDGALARRALELALDDVARMLAWDLQQAGPAARPAGAAAGKKQRVELLDWRGVLPMDASPITEQGGRTWLRTGSGELVSTGEVSP